MSVKIYNTGGGYTAKDATALPGDVVRGKIFYNGTGRQIGSGDFLKKKSVVLLPYMAGEETDLGRLRMLQKYIFFYDPGFWIMDEMANYTTLSWSGNLVAMNVYVLLGFSINGYQCNYAFNMSDPDKIEGYEMFALSVSDYHDDLIFELYIHNGNLYLNQLSEGYTLEVFYA